MGLDVFFLKHEGRKALYNTYGEKAAQLTVINNNFQEGDDNTERETLDAEMTAIIDKLNEESVGTEFAYFREMYFLLHFFKCEVSRSLEDVTKNDMDVLINDCQEVLDDHSKAEELLPINIEEGEYNDAYFADVQTVHDKLAEVVDTIDWENDLIQVYLIW